MTRNSPCLITALASIALLTASCKKDELTVVSTATPPHGCGKTIIHLNVDSILQSPPPLPGEADLQITICECDTIAFIPVNLPSDCEFHHWIIDQGQADVFQNELLLDSITVASELWMDFDDCDEPQHQIRIQVDTEPCE
jgi:hypothetical protein